MAGSFEVHEDGTVTVTFAYRATAGKISTTVGDAVNYLYPATFGEVLDEDGVKIPFDELTNQQTLDVIDAWVKKTIIDLAKQYQRKYLLDIATAEAAIVAGDKYI